MPRRTTSVQFGLMLLATLLISACAQRAEFAITSRALQPSELNIAVLRVEHKPGRIAGETVDYDDLGRTTFVVRITNNTDRVVQLDKLQLARSTTELNFAHGARGLGARRANLYPVITPVPHHHLRFEPREHLELELIPLYKNELVYLDTGARITHRIAPLSWSWTTTIEVRDEDLSNRREVVVSCEGETVMHVR